MVLWAVAVAVAVGVSSDMAGTVSDVEVVGVGPAGVADGFRVGELCIFIPLLRLRTGAVLEEE